MFLLGATKSIPGIYKRRLYDQVYDQVYDQDRKQSSFPLRLMGRDFYYLLSFKPGIERMRKKRKKTERRGDEILTCRYDEHCLPLTKEQHFV